MAIEQKVISLVISYTENNNWRNIKRVELDLTVPTCYGVSEIRSALVNLISNLPETIFDDPEPNAGEETEA